ncbi:MAG: lipoate--protein ligase [Bacteriovoracaceae bacterium]|nr:lipoate--protein ligase [Bacteriovoracaceae bacterium]
MPKPPVKVLISTTFDPWFNLATEDWIFKDMDPKTKILFLWRNEETVVIGRFQNPWIECNTALMEQDSIKLARRQSGGGAVFHDLGNTNFTFLTGKDDFDKKVNNSIITNAINSFGLDSYASGRNDILVDDNEGPKKISGSAFKEKRDRSFHHGTLLINADLTRLGNYLNPDKKKLVGKGIKSVRSRVTNLAALSPKITHDSLTGKIIEEFFNHHQTSGPIEELDHSYLKAIRPLNEYYESLKDWNWRFGETPKFNHHMVERFDWGEMDVHIDSHKGLIEQCQIFSDTLHPQLVESLAALFPGRSYTKETIDIVTDEISREMPFLNDELTQFGTWLKTQIV